LFCYAQIARKCINTVHYVFILSWRLTSRSSK